MKNAEEVNSNEVTRTSFEDKKSARAAEKLKNAADHYLPKLVEHIHGSADPSDEASMDRKDAFDTLMASRADMDPAVVLDELRTYAEGSPISIPDNETMLEETEHEKGQAKRIQTYVTEQLRNVLQEVQNSDPSLPEAENPKYRTEEFIEKYSAQLRDNPEGMTELEAEAMYEEFRQIASEFYTMPSVEEVQDIMLGAQQEAA